MILVYWRMQSIELERKLSEEKTEASCILNTLDFGNHQGSTLPHMCAIVYHMILKEDCAIYARAVKLYQVLEGVPPYSYRP